jgi:hypothetical protein
LIFVRRKKKRVDLVTIIPDCDNSGAGKFFLCAEKSEWICGIPDTGSLCFYNHRGVLVMRKPCNVEAECGDMSLAGIGGSPPLCMSQNHQVSISNNNKG